MARRFRVHPGELVGLFVRGYFEAIVLVVVCGLLIRWLLVSPMIASDDSMAPGLLRGDHFLTLKVRYGIDVSRFNWRLPTSAIPKIGSLVILRDPVSRHGSIRRVLGGPGDQVEMVAGVVKVNGDLAKIDTTDLLGTSSPTSSIQFESAAGASRWVWLGSQPWTAPPVLVPPGHIFVGPDHRDAALKLDPAGVVSADWVVGEPILRYAATDGLPRILGEGVWGPLH
jgi:signal peptidase I